MREREREREEEERGRETTNKREREIEKLQVSVISEERVMPINRLTRNRLSPEVLNQHLFIHFKLGITHHIICSFKTSVNSS